MIEQLSHLVLCVFCVSIAARALMSACRDAEERDLFTFHQVWMMVFALLGAAMAALHLDLALGFTL